MSGSKRLTVTSGRSTLMTVGANVSIIDIRAPRSKGKGEKGEGWKEKEGERRRGRRRVSEKHGEGAWRRYDGEGRWRRAEKGSDQTIGEEEK